MYDAVLCDGHMKANPMPDDITLFANDFIAVKEHDGYTYAHLTRTAGRLVALLPFRGSGDAQTYLARVEVCPAHSDDPGVYSITGGVRPNETPLEAAARELTEESGYQAAAAEFTVLGEVRPTKQADTTVTLLAVDVTDKVQAAIVGDGTRWEQDAGVKWVTYADGLGIIDPLFITLMARLRGQTWQSEQNNSM